jgi:hypothetical protein
MNAKGATMPELPEITVLACQMKIESLNSDLLDLAKICRLWYNIGRMGG